MLLTTDVLAAYVGGQLEVQNIQDGFTYRGEIAKAIVEEDFLSVELVWLAKADLFKPTGWVNYPMLSYTCHVKAAEVLRAGMRLVFLSSIDEVIFFYHRTGSKLDPSEVFGLTLSS